MEASRPGKHERSKSSFSIRSDKSGKSGKSNKISLKENEAERRRNRFSEQNTSNPNRALNEEQPSARAEREESTLIPIRTLQFRDSYGNAIIDPDASNPSRSRMERPLDTIRAFEAAIDLGHKRKSQLNRAETTDNYASSRRSSFVDADPALNPRAPLSRHRASYVHDNYNPRPPNPRYSTAPIPGRVGPDYGVYPINGYRDSHETVTTGESYGSQGTEQWTDPSSENSSIDRIQPPPHKNSYSDAYAGYPQPNGGSPIHDHGRGPQGRAYQPSPSPHRNPPFQPKPLPVPEHAPPRNIIPLGGAPAPPPHSQTIQQPTYSSAGGQKPSAPPIAQKQPEQKRKSWLKRRFSKG